MIYFNRFANCIQFDEFFVFYKLIQICNEYGVKLTSVLKGLGVSPGNLKRWKGGAAVISYTLAKIANYFYVSVDYFFTEDKTENEITDDSNSIRKIYSILRAYPDYIACPSFRQHCFRRRDEGNRGIYALLSGLSA